LLRTGMRLIGLVGFAAISVVGLAACGGGPNTLALVGSDTTLDVMGPISTQFNNTASADTASNVPSVLTGSQTFTVPSDKRCAAKTYDSGANKPPNGSGAGISALVADSTGCIDIARSSRGRSASDPASLEFYAFAKDAVSWARFPVACPGGDVAPAGCAPTNLTQDQLKGIYLCDQPGNVPKFTNWNQVGGDSEPIARYLPQTGSGTLSFFETRILGLTSAQQGVLDGTGCATQPTRIEENHGNQVPVADRDNGILPYSFAQWTAQSNGTITDDRAGATLGQINGVTPNATNVNNNTFLGRRYVYNVAKTGSPSYAAAIQFIGVNSSGNGYLCTDDATKNSTLTQYGFILNSFAPAGSGLPNSRCRKDPTPL
jgi:phosphate transport system substrate-binding protein